MTNFLRNVCFRCGAVGYRYGEIGHCICDDITSPEGQEHLEKTKEALDRKVDWILGEWNNLGSDD